MCVRGEVGILGEGDIYVCSRFVKKMNVTLV
jgi:hypothetical protein